MPSLLRDRACNNCGHHHNFCLPVGDVAAGEVFEYVCPETGKRAWLRADAQGEASEAYLQGAVALELGERARKAA